MLNKFTNFNFKGKRVLLRVDFNVPLVDFEVVDDFRIRQSLGTIKYLIQKKAKVILISHFGQPQGKVVEELRLTPIQSKLSQLLKRPVLKADDCLGEKVERLIREMKEGEVLLLENLRFHSGEERNEKSFAQALSSLADVYVNDAFSVSHRTHASIVGLPQYLPSFSGFLLEKEITLLSQIVQDPSRPLVVLIGGAKIENKISVIKTFLTKADYLLLGGKVANSLLSFRGVYAHRENLSDEMRGMIREISLDTKNLYLPEDGLVSSDLLGQGNFRELEVSRVKEGELILDLGPKTIKNYSVIIQKAKTIFWAGPLGFFENPSFRSGTQKIAEAIVKNKKAFKIAGGGETNEIIKELGLRQGFNYLSTGGGAMLEFLSGKKLPGVEALK